MSCVLRRLSPLLANPISSRRLSIFQSLATRSSAGETAQAQSEPQSDQVNAASVDDSTVKELKDEISKISADNATLTEKSRELEDKYMRALAETENVRTRLTKQISDAKIFAIQGFCKDLTDIADILQMAVESVPKDQLNSNEPLKQLYEGLSMTEARLLQVFKRHGLTPINPLGDQFNPNEHEAVVAQEVEGKDAGTVLFVSKCGYKLHDRVIRPATVGVAK